MGLTSRIAEEEGMKSARRGTPQKEKKWRLRILRDEQGLF
jgi:hypothetical protein